MANGELTHKEVNTDNWILFAFAGLSWLATVVNLIIIKRLRMWNGYLLLITSMAVFQLIYDTSFMMRVIPGYKPCLAWHMMGNIGGIGSSFWTNIMCFILLYVLLKVRSVSIFKIYPLLFLYGGILPIAFGISSYFALRHTNDDDDGNRGYLYCTFKHDRFATFVNNFYYWGRIVSILFNFFAFLFAWFRLHRMGIQPYFVPGVDVSRLNGATAANTLANSRIGATGTGADELESGMQRSTITAAAGVGATNGILMLQRKHNDPQHVALTVLVSRMKYYPLWQALCRFGPAWNEFRDYKYSTPVTSAFAAMTGPSLGLCMFIIFLVSSFIFSFYFVVFYLYLFFASHNLGCAAWCMGSLSRTDLVA
jgi:hypothetical protein